MKSTMHVKVSHCLSIKGCNSFNTNVDTILLWMMAIVRWSFLMHTITLKPFCWQCKLWNTSSFYKYYNSFNTNLDAILFMVQWFLMYTITLNPFWHGKFCFSSVSLWISNILIIVMRNAYNDQQYQTKFECAITIYYYQREFL